jgi:hypothetical protein
MYRALLPSSILATTLGIGIAYIDSRPGWDDTGVSAFLVFLASGLCGYIAPQKPWIPALAVSIWIPLVGIFSNYNMTSLLALIPAFAGAYAGSVVRRKIFTH